MTANSEDLPSTAPENNSRNHETDSGLGDLVRSDRDFARISEFRFSHPDLKIIDTKVTVDLENMYSMYVKNGRTMDALDDWLEHIASEPHTEEQQNAFVILKMYHRYLGNLTRQDMFDEEKAEAYFRAQSGPSSIIDVGEIEAVPLQKTELTEAAMAAKAIDSTEPKDMTTWTESDDHLYRAAVEVNEADSDRQEDINRLKNNLPRKQVRRLEEVLEIPHEPRDAGRHMQKRSKH